MGAEAVCPGGGVPCFFEGNWWPIHRGDPDLHHHAGPVSCLNQDLEMMGGAENVLSL